MKKSLGMMVVYIKMKLEVIWTWILLGNKDMTFCLRFVDVIEYGELKK